jgi:hypothetical protein
MTTMTIVDVVNIVYPGQFALKNVAFGQDGNSPIFITKWSVPNVAEPTVESLIAQIPLLQKQFDLLYFQSVGTPQLVSYIDSVAQKRQYENAVSCASYANSGVASWKAEASAFIAWRDSVYNYAIAQEALMQSGTRTVPTFAEFQTELPLIVWPS